MLRPPVSAKFKKNVTYFLFTERRAAHLTVVLSGIENLELRTVVVHLHQQTSFLPFLLPLLRQNSYNTTIAFFGLLESIMV
jgi:hypothetical protein